MKEKKQKEPSSVLSISDTPPLPPQQGQNHCEKALPLNAAFVEGAGEEDETKAELERKEKQKQKERKNVFGSR